MPALRRRAAARPERAATLLALTAIAVGTLATPATPALAATAPTVSSVSPGSGPEAGGTKVTVRGHGFTHVHSVTFGSSAGKSLHVLSSSKLQVTAPKHPAGTVYVRVHTGHGTSGTKAAARFAYLKPPTKGAIAGRVTSKASGHGLAGVVVDVFNPDSSSAAHTHTKSDGTYRVAGLPAGQYYVCFDVTGVTKGSATGYAYQCYRHTAWDGLSGDFRAGTVAVRVTAGHTKGGIDAALSPGGAVTGTVTSVDGDQPLRGVIVEVGLAEGREIARTVTDRHGHYLLPGLTPSSTGYVVCFDASNARGGPSAGGYLDQCYVDQPWTGFFDVLPDGTTAVPVRAGHTASGVDASLDPAAKFSGTVTAGPDGAGLREVNVLAIVPGDQGYQVSGSTYTAADGSYSLVVPPAADGYYLCFGTDLAEGGSSQTGYEAQCYDDQPWADDVGFAPSPGAMQLPAPAGTDTRADAALDSAAGISGTVTAVTGGGKLKGVEVYVLNGNYVAQATTGAHGAYSVTGLPASATGYDVCFEASAATGGSSSGGYFDECYDNARWDGDPDNLPGGVDLVPTTAGAASTVDAKLSSSGTVSGAVTADDGGAPLSNVYVEVYDASQPVGNGPVGAQITADGRFSIAGLPSGTYHLCFDGTDGNGGPSTNGYQSECYKDQPWDAVDADVPATSARVHVTAGTTTAGKDAALATAP